MALDGRLRADGVVVSAGVLLCAGVVDGAPVATCGGVEGEGMRVVGRVLVEAGGVYMAPTARLGCRRR
jgi:hypothetical protein